MNFQNEVRLHHWGTQSYSAHKALGNLYTGLDPLLDTFVETFVGAKGKEQLKNINSLQLNGSYKINLNTVIESFEDYLQNEIEKEIGSDQTALLNIRDEMLALVQQTKYLLTLS